MNEEDMVTIIVPTLDIHGQIMETEFSQHGPAAKRRKRVFFPNGDAVYFLVAETEMVVEENWIEITCSAEFAHEHVNAEYICE